MTVKAPGGIARLSKRGKGQQLPRVHAQAAHSQGKPQESTGVVGAPKDAKEEQTYSLPYEGYVHFAVRIAEKLRHEAEVRRAARRASTSKDQEMGSLRDRTADEDHDETLAVRSDVLVQWYLSAFELCIPQSVPLSKASECYSMAVENLVVDGLVTVVSEDSGTSSSSGEHSVSGSGSSSSSESMMSGPKCVGSGTAVRVFRLRENDLFLDWAFYSEVESYQIECGHVAVVEGCCDGTGGPDEDFKVKRPPTLQGDGRRHAPGAPAASAPQLSCLETVDKREDISSIGKSGRRKSKQPEALFAAVP
eukprot:GHVT01102556.1.p1 GENE.GHVT01102556.1~~GHVT01102556.1.p1  ORF type:complete len:306 (+),score=52.33 GHVT01102556.1:1129-2046(+)